MNTSNVHENVSDNTVETLSLRAAAEKVGVSPSTLVKHRQRLLDAGARQVGTPPRWAITVEQLERAGWVVRAREHPGTCTETSPETPSDAGPEWRELWQAERTRAERAEQALAEERRRVDALMGSLVMAVRQLELGGVTTSRDDEVVRPPRPTSIEEPGPERPVKAPWWGRLARRSGRG